MTSRLGLYNRALRQLGERTLANLGENIEPRRALDAAWDDGFLRYCLEQGQWNFAIRSVELTFSPDITPAFGYRYAFDVPEDWVRTVGLASDEYFTAPLLQIAMEGEYWFADLDTIYLRYVSDDAAFGGDLSLWPETFTQFAAAHLAEEVVGALTASEAKGERIKRDVRRLLTDARSKDALNESAVFLPVGGWTRARRGSTSGGERGSRSGLTG
jgi:hypothetical protein